MWSKLKRVIRDVVNEVRFDVRFGLLVFWVLAIIFYILLLVSVCGFESVLNWIRAIYRNVVGVQLDTAVDVILRMSTECAHFFLYVLQVLQHVLTVVVTPFLCSFILYLINRTYSYYMYGLVRCREAVHTVYCTLDNLLDFANTLVPFIATPEGAGSFFLGWMLINVVSIWVGTKLLTDRTTRITLLCVIMIVLSVLIFALFIFFGIVQSGK